MYFVLVSTVIYFGLGILTSTAVIAIPGPSALLRTPGVGAAKYSHYAKDDLYEPHHFINSIASL